MTSEVNEPKCLQEISYYNILLGEFTHKAEASQRAEELQAKMGVKFIGEGCDEHDCLTLKTSNQFYSAEGLQPEVFYISNDLPFASKLEAEKMLKKWSKKIENIRIHESKIMVEICH